MTRACPLNRRNLCYSTKQPRTGSSLHLGEHFLFCNQGLIRSILREGRWRPLVAPRSSSAGSGTERPYGTSAVRFWFPGGRGTRRTQAKRLPWLPWRSWLLRSEGCCFAGPARAAGPAGVSFRVPSLGRQSAVQNRGKRGTRARAALAGLLGSSPSLLQTSPYLCLPGQVSCFGVWKKSPASLVLYIDSLGMGFPLSWNFLVPSQTLSNIASFPPSLVSSHLLLGRH